MFVCPAGGVCEPGDALGHRGGGAGPRHRPPLHPLLQMLHRGQVGGREAVYLSGYDKMVL